MRLPPAPSDVVPLEYKSPPAAVKGSRNRTWLAVVAGLVGIAAILMMIGRLQSNSDARQRTQAPSSSMEKASSSADQQLPSGKAADQAALKEEFLRKARKNARENYVRGLQKAFRNIGVAASIWENEDGQLVITSHSFKLKPDRDEVMRNIFVPGARRDMCTMGFKTLYLRDDGVFADGDVYGLGCPETKAEMEERSRKQFAARQAFVDQIRRTLRSKGLEMDMTVTQSNGEIVLTSDPRPTPDMLRALFAREMSGENQSLCNMGFRAIRARASSDDNGTVLQITCEK
jgi:hypothetical protein